MLPATSPPSVDPPERPRTRRQVIATASAGVIAFVGGTTLFAIASEGPLGIQSLWWALVNPQLLLWVLGVATLGIAGRRLSDVGFAVISVALAPLSTFLVLVVGQPWTGMMPAPWAAGFVWQAGGIVGAAAIGAVTGAHFARRAPAAEPAVAPDPAPTPAAGGPGSASSVSALREPAPMGTARPHTGLTLWAIGLLVVGTAFAFALPMQWFDVYFAIWESAPPPTDADGARFVWTAGLGVAFLLAAVVVAIIRRRGGIIALAVVALACTLIGAFVFQVPKGRLLPGPSYEDDGRDSPVCYGTSGDCPGG